MHRVLIYGHDPILLTTRQLLLERAGFKVWVSQRNDDLKKKLSAHPVDLIILCHTVRAAERSAILDFAHDCQRNLAILFLSTDWQSPSIAENDAVFSTLDGPYDFLRIVCELTHEPAPSPFGSNSQNLGNELCPDLQAR